MCSGPEARAAVTGAGTGWVTRVQARFTASACPSWSACRNLVNWTGAGAGWRGRDMIKRRSTMQKLCAAAGVGLGLLIMAVPCLGAEAKLNGSVLLRACAQVLSHIDTI